MTPAAGVPAPRRAAGGVPSGAVVAGAGAGRARDVDLVRGAAVSTGGDVSPPVPTGAGIPALVADVEVSRPVPDLPAVDGTGRRAARAWLLVRVHTEPIGSLVLDLPPGGLTGARILDYAYERYGAAIRSRLAAPEPAFLASRSKILAAAPPITVVVCTRDRPRPLRRCLDSLLVQDYPQFRVLVVDNAPTGDATARLVDQVARTGPVDYLPAPVPGLSRARNAAVTATPGEILAWIDDDEIADPYWLAEIARALAEHPDADAVSGVVVPAELASRAQVWFEDFGGHSKGRGFTPAVFDPSTARTQSPLYPLPPFGTGANMVFRPGVIEGIGGFDPALGAGTPAMGSEDTLAFMELLRQGGTVVYQPSAVVRHFHRTDLAGLRRQLVGYGVGLTAAYTSLVLHHPDVLPKLLGLVPTAARDLFGSGGERTATIGDDFPRELLRANLRGMLRGPLAYLAGRRQERRLARISERARN